MPKSIRAVLIELGNTGIEGSLKPNDYYNKKIDVALKDLSEIILSEKKIPIGEEHLHSNLLTAGFNEAISHISNIILGG